MFITYLLIAAISSIAVIAVAFTVSYFMTLMDMKRNIQNHDTNSANKAKVEGVVGSYMQSAKTVKVGLFKGGDRVGNVTIECPQGTSVKVGDEVYV